MESNEEKDMKEEMKKIDIGPHPPQVEICFIDPKEPGFAACPCGKEGCGWRWNEVTKTWDRTTAMIDDQDNDFLRETARACNVSFIRGAILSTPLGLHFKQWCEENAVNLQDETDFIHWWNCYLAGCQAAAKLTIAELKEMVNCSPVAIEEI